MPCLKRLKTYLRTVLGQERLSSLTTLKVLKSQFIYIDQVTSLRLTRHTKKRTESQFKIGQQSILYT